MHAWTRRSLIGSLGLATTVIMAGAAGAAPIKITMQKYSESPQDHAYVQWQEALATEFNQEHPDIQIDLISPSSDSIKAMVAAGSAPDIAIGDPYEILDLARNGALEDLTPYLAMEHQYDDWFPSAFRLYAFAKGTYGLPQDLQLGGIFYNKDAFAQAGVAEPTADWTFADLQAKAIRLTQRDANNAITRFGFRIPTWRNWVNVVWAFGGDFVDDWNDPTRFTGNTAETANALRYLNDLVVSGAVQDRAHHNAAGTTTAFVQQNIAMVLTNTVAMQDFGSIANFQWDVAPIANGPAGRPTFINARGWELFKASMHKAEAWTVLKYFTSAEALHGMVGMGVVPPSRSVVLSQWLPSLSMPEHRALLLNDIDQARSPGQLSGDIFDPIQEESDAVIWGQKSVSAALDNMATEVGAALARLQ